MLSIALKGAELRRPGYAARGLRIRLGSRGKLRLRAGRLPVYPPAPLSLQSLENARS